MVKNRIGKTLLKNRYLTVSCLLLLFGTILGIVALKSLPEELFQKICILVTTQKSDFFHIFCDQFIFSEILLSAVFLSGFSLSGHLTNGTTVLLSGIIYGIKNSASYTVFGSDHVISALIEFFIFYLFYVYLFLTMAECSFQQTQKLFLSALKEKDEKTHYNAKSHAVKFICFTVLLALFSVLYAYLSLLIG